MANGPEGLAIIDIENPERPKLDQMFNANGAVNASMFALVADGKNGLRVLQLISPDTVPGHMGFSPRPNPQLIATYHTHGEAVAVSRGLDRDRVVDETGNQTVVFGRRGSRPFNQAEMSAFYHHYSDLYTTNRVGERTGPIYQVEDVAQTGGQLTTRAGQPLNPTLEFKPEPKPAPSQPEPRDRLVRREK